VATDDRQSDHNITATRESVPWPAYAFVPGGPWPHPTSSPQGHSFGLAAHDRTPIVGDAWDSSPAYLRGAALFNAGYYWEAHEAWESLWHAHGRKGATADVIKALIKLAAAGVKVRERQPHGVITHSRRASTLFAASREKTEGRLLGLDLGEWEKRALAIAEAPPVDPGTRDARVTRVFTFRIEPKSI
jgi:uncharacterized protein